MRFTGFALLCLVASVAWVQADGDIPTTSDPFGPNTTPTEPSTTSTTEAPSTTTTTAAPTTVTTTTTTEAPTTVTTTTTTEAPTTPTTTTTPVPSTTTPVPSTTTPVPSTTTPVPSTTIPSTTPKPKPPNPNPGIWTVKDDVTNVTCIVMKMAATFLVPYNTNDGVRNATVVLAANATSNGTCVMTSEEYQGITLSWLANDESKFYNQLHLFFRKNVSKLVEVEGSIGINQFAVSQITVKVFPDNVNFPNATSEKHIEASIHDANLFATNLNNSYLCKSEEQVPMTITNTAEETVFIHMKNVQLEAFRVKETESFSSPKECMADGQTSDIVPIAVGCALAALVVIVLIAYLIGRRRARQRGYQSV